MTIRGKIGNLGECLARIPLDRAFAAKELSPEIRGSTLMKMQQHDLLIRVGRSGHVGRCVLWRATDRARKMRGVE
ncbi:hypothetical protein M0R72_11235 [Candidatus Pacearchaeota archaeon]|nr:hypothetical protein [Candidatus Pacearchaeota archaeon]